ncbi:MAG: SusD/RagB family nutrient-binding outer membrane lipoprotein, partial [Saprospiraceae bacterium]
MLPHFLHEGIFYPLMHRGFRSGFSAFRLSYNRFDQKGLFPNSHMERNTIGFNGSLDLGNQLSVGLGMNYVITRTQGRAVTGYENGGGGRNPAPSRISFPTNEQAPNANGYNQGVSLLGGPDKLSTRVWWDV